MTFGVPVAQQIRDTQRRLKTDLTSGVATSVINSQKDLKRNLNSGVHQQVKDVQKGLKTRLGLVDQPIKLKRKRKKGVGAVRDAGILSRF